MLVDIKRRLEAAKGPVDGVTAASIANSLSPWATETEEWKLFVAALRGSLDAALGLVERVLPGWQIVSSNRHFAYKPKDKNGWAGGYIDKGPFAYIVRPNTSIAGRADAPTQPLAILTAAVSALIAQEGTESGRKALSGDTP